MLSDVPVLLLYLPIDIGIGVCIGIGVGIGNGTVNFEKGFSPLMHTANRFLS